MIASNISLAIAVVSTVMVVASAIPTFSAPHQPRRIILIGDSVIDNGAYVQSGEPDVAKQLKSLLPAYDIDKRAVDGSVTIDVLNSQLHDIRSHDLVVLSTGGNDALSRMNLIDSQAKTTPAMILADLWKAREQFRTHFAAVIAALEKNNSRVLVLTVYNPNFAAHGTTMDKQHAAEAGLSLFNDVIQQHALEKNFTILEMRTLFDDTALYANPIEPSAVGGAKIAEKIRDWALSK